MNETTNTETIKTLTTHAEPYPGGPSDNIAILKHEHVEDDPYFNYTEYGYCFFGTTKDGLNYESDDVFGWETADEAEKQAIAAQEEYDNER